MGSGISLPKLLPSKITSQEDLKLKTKDVTELANNLFTFMYTQYDVNEVWDIASKPEEYIVELSHLIDNHFHIIGYTSETTTTGEIYFTRTKDLLKHFDKSTQTATDRKENEKNAKIIAFFFVRIFQILGAMLLVVKNATLNIDIPSDDKYGRPILGKALPRTFRGGGPADMLFLGPFDFLRKHMSSLNTADKSYITETSDTKTYKITPNLFFKFKDLTGDKVTKESVKLMKPTFIILTKVRGTTVIKPYEFELVVYSISPTTLDNKVPKKSETFSIPQETIFYIKTTDRVMTEREILRESVTIRYKQDNESERISYEVVPSDSVNTIISKGYTLVRDLPLIIQDYTLAKAATRNPSGILELKEVVTRDTSEEQTSLTVKQPFKPEKISIKTIRDGYSDLMPRTSDGKRIEYGPHCIKRATELLDAISIEKGYTTDSHTNICRFSAPDETKQSISLDEYKPTKSIAQLYGKLDVKRVSKADFNEAIQIIEAFVKPSDSSDPTMTTFKTDTLIKDNQKEESESLKSGLARLKAAFDSESKSDPTGFADISMKKPNECGTLTSEEKNPDGSVKLGKTMTGQLQSVSQELLAYHVNNTVKITDFLKNIFTIEFKNGVWTPKGINNSILFAGFPALDTITNQARELLLDYYVGCETVYQKGVKVWKDENKKSAAVAPAAPAAPATAASAAPAPAAPAPPAPAPVPK